MPILKLRGARALSPFRLAKLNNALAALHPDARVVGSRFLHFVETERPLTADESALLDRLLAYGEPPDGAAGPEVLVVPRLGTISPWSSKATDIARNCGLAAVRRIERGIAYTLAAAAPVERIAPALHDRMTETVLASLDEAERLFRHVAPRPLAPCRCGRRAARLEDANARWAWRCRPTRSTICVDVSAAPAATRPTPS